MATKEKKAIRRLLVDQQELEKFPVANVSAVPLDNNMLEWHCNIRHEDIIFHLILFFPDNYPYISPSAEFVPVGFQYTGGATKSGRKGTKICLNIFSDFADIHTEWANQKGLGWSPGYTVQTVLMNVIAFIAESQPSKEHYAYKLNLDVSKKFSCADCGHSYAKPYPPIESESKGVDDQGSGKGKGKGKGKSTKGAAAKGSSASEEDKDTAQIIDYISKECLSMKKPTSTDDLFGYGLVVSGPPHRPALTTPCEFLTGRSYYGMKKSVNIVHSVLKEELKFFLPLYIHPAHGQEIKGEFEKTLMQIAEIMPKCNPKKTPMAEMIIKTIPNLMSATVVDFSKGTQHTSDNSLNGYFVLHRLLLWALETYPELQGEVESKLKNLIASEENRTKKACPHIGELLMLLAASEKYKWEDLADAYLSESFRRNVMWYVKDDSKLGMLDTPQAYRMKHTLERTAVSRKLLAFQVLFLDIALPKGMTRKQIIKRYDDNLGFPTATMVTQMKAACSQIDTQLKSYKTWFQLLKLTPPAEDELFTRLVEAVRFSILTDGYNWSFWKTGGGWGEVLRKYADMKQQHKEEQQKLKDGKGSASTTKIKKGKGDADEDTPMEVDEAPESSKAGKKGSSTRGRSQSGSRGKAAARGRKRKSCEAHSDEDEDEEIAPKVAKKGSAPARGRGRGRGRGSAAKRGR